LVATLTSGTWVERDFTPEVLRELDVRLALLPTQGIHIAAAAIAAAFASLADGVAPTELAGQSMPHLQFIEMIGFPQIEELQRTYLPAVVE
jgi:methylisocitrate lyase